MDLKAKGKVLFSGLGEHLLQQILSSSWKMKPELAWGQRSISSLKVMLLLGCMSTQQGGKSAGGSHSGAGVREVCSFGSSVLVEVHSLHRNPPPPAHLPFLSPPMMKSDTASALS